MLREAGEAKRTVHEMNWITGRHILRDLTRQWGLQRPNATVGRILHATCARALGSKWRTLNVPYPIAIIEAASPYVDAENTGLEQFSAKLWHKILKMLRMCHRHSHSTVDDQCGWWAIHRRP